MKSWLWQIICFIGILVSTQPEICRKACGWSTRMVVDVYRTGSKTWWRLNRMGKKMEIPQLLLCSEGRRLEPWSWWVCCSCLRFYRSRCTGTLEKVTWSALSPICIPAIGLRGRIAGRILGNQAFAVGSLCKIRDRVKRYDAFQCSREDIEGAVGWHRSQPWAAEHLLVAMQCRQNVGGLSRDHRCKLFAKNLSRSMAAHCRAVASGGASLYRLPGQNHKCWVGTW